MSGGKLVVQISQNTTTGFEFQKNNVVMLAGKSTGLGISIVTSITKIAIKKVITKAITRGTDTGRGY